MTGFQKIWAGVAFIAGVVILLLQFIEVSTGKVVGTYSLILVLLLALGAILWDYAFGTSAGMGFSGLAKLVLLFIGILFIVTAICLLARLELVSDCLGCGPAKTPTPTATFTPSLTPTSTATPTPSPTATFSPTPTPTPIVVQVSVFSAHFPFKSTGITVHAGDNIEITVTGVWNCGRQAVTPDGYDEKYSDTVLVSAPVCSLIGAISDSPPDEKFDRYFFVGRRGTWIAQDTGKLYLGCNDSLGKFGDNPTDSQLEVRIVVSYQ